MDKIKSFLKEKDLEWYLFIFCFVGMAIYYIYRMFSLTPWYDELYTYHMFISRGPIYAAIHWPVPNNHMGYTSLSGFFMVFGNSYIALRGVAYLASLGTLILLFRILHQTTRKGLAVMAVALFACMNLINSLAVQGRGYSLTTFLFVLALYSVNKIYNDCEKRRYYIYWIIALWWSLYAVPSSAYFVMTLCLAGGFALLSEKKYKQLIRLIVSSVIAALCTMITYSMVWLAIGSNLLVKDETSVYFGLGHGTILLKHPLSAWLTGMNYMLATPYIQSVSRSEMLHGFWGWIRMLLNYFYNNSGVWLPVLILLSFILVNGLWNKLAEGNHNKRVLLVLVDVGFIFTPIVLIIQSKLPYLRVFSYFGVILVVLFTLACEQFFKTIKERWMYGFSFLAILLAIILLASPEYNMQYGDREAAIEDAYRQVDLSKYNSICITDVNQEYLLNFLASRRDGITTVIEDGDLVLFDKNMLDKDYNEFNWEWFHTYETIDHEYVNNHMEQYYENDYYVLYVKQK